MEVSGENVGVIAGRFVPGAATVELASLSQHLGMPVPRGLVEKRVTDIDETEVTLAIDAMKRLLEDSGLDPGKLSGLYLASRDADGTAPWLAEVLHGDRLDVHAFASSRETAGAALAAACEGARRSQAPVLFLCAQDTTWTTPKEEDGDRLESGAGAVALLIGPGAPVVLQAHHVRHHLHAPPPVAGLVQELRGDSGARAHLVVATRSPGEQKSLLRGLELDPLVAYPVERLGDLGPAAPAAALLEGLAAGEPGDRVDLVVPGDGRTMGLRFSVEEVARVVPPGKALAEDGLRLQAPTADHVQRAWSENGGAEPRGAYVPLPAFHAQDPARLRFEGGQCVSCERLLFPPRQRCPSCGGSRFEVRALSGQGTVYSMTRISTGGAPAEFAPLQEARGAYAVAVVELAEGPRVAAMLTGPRMDGQGVKIGDPVRLVVRLLYVQEGVARYSFKALPAATAK